MRDATTRLGNANNVVSEPPLRTRMLSGVPLQVTKRL